MHGDGARVHRGRCRGPGQSAITVHGDGVRVKGTGAERDNGARGRCTGAREGAGRGPGQSAITVHGDGVWVHGKVQGTGQSAITVHGDGVWVHGKVQGTGAERDNGARGRCTGEGHRGRAR